MKLIALIISTIILSLSVEPLVMELISENQSELHINLCDCCDNGNCCTDSCDDSKSEHDTNKPDSKNLCNNDSCPKCSIQHQVLFFSNKPSEEERSSPAISFNFPLIESAPISYHSDIWHPPKFIS